MNETQKPRCKLTGTDGNVFALAARVMDTLKKARLPKQAAEVQAKLFTCHSYDEALHLFMDYVEAH